MNNCCICGINRDIVHKVQGVLSANFNDFQYLHYDSEYICPRCQSYLSDTGFEGKPLRCFNVIIIGEIITKLAHNEIAKVLLAPPDPPFTIIVTYSHKKHIFLHAKPTTNLDSIYVATDKEDIVFSHSQFVEIYTICNELYNKVGLSKNDILYHLCKWKLVEEYGIEKYYGLIAKLKKYYYTAFLRFVVYVLVKEKAHD